MQFGLHVSIAGSVASAPINAHEAKCECFQMFSRSPRGGPAPVLTNDVVTTFKNNCERFGLTGSYIHTPYYINFASANSRIRYGSINIIREELERASLLGVTYVMTHLGSAKDIGEKAALKQVAEGLQKALDGYKGSATLLLENSAGAGKVIGDNFEDLSFLLKQLASSPARQPSMQTGICFDTCHAFTSGYDLRTPAAVKKTLDAFNTTIGIEHLKLIHANDSMAGLGEHKDRHEHIGVGKIGIGGFRALVNHPKLKEVNMVLETPHDGKEIDDLATLRKLRAEK
ncbi:MAG: deoxyribonuclease IV [Parcubacteria group bacterium]